MPRRATASSGDGATEETADAWIAAIKAPVMRKAIAANGAKTMIALGTLPTKTLARSEFRPSTPAPTRTLARPEFGLSSQWTTMTAHGRQFTIEDGAFPEVRQSIGETAETSFECVTAEPDALLAAPVQHLEDVSGWKTTSPPGGKLVGAAGFEPTTTSPPDWCATRLRHAPTGVRV